MPYVIQIGASNGDDTAYYAGPTAAMGLATRGSGSGSAPPAVFNVNAATRIPWALPGVAEQTMNNLRHAGVAANIVYDLPKPAKAIKWLFELPGRLLP